MSFQSVRDLDVKGHRVFLRADLNVPLKDGKIGDATRIRETLPTLRCLLEGGAAANREAAAPKQHISERLAGINLAMLLVLGFSIAEWVGVLSGRRKAVSSEVPYTARLATAE